MRSFPIGVGVLACGAAFGAGWIAATLSTQQPAPALSHVPVPSSGAEDPERSLQLESLRMPGRMEKPDRPSLGRRERPGSPEKSAESGENATGLKSESPIRTQRDIVMAFRAAIEQDRQDCNRREQSASPDKKSTAEGREPAPVLNSERPVRTQADAVASVRAALEQDREDRDRHERELRDGPYGEFNYDVNWMSERVSGLNDDQKQRYASLLAWRRHTLTLLEQRLHAKEIAQEEFENGLRGTHDYTNQLMRQVLDARQFQDYQAYFAGRLDIAGNTGRPAPTPCAGATPR